MFSQQTGKHSERQTMSSQQGFLLCDCLIRVWKGGGADPAFRPVPIVLVKCWKVAHWNAKKLLKNCQKSKKLLPKFQKLLPKFLAIFI